MTTAKTTKAKMTVSAEKPMYVSVNNKKVWSKPGWKSTEFWGASIISVLNIAKAFPLPNWTTPAVWIAYAIARGMSKMGGPEIEQ